MTITECNEQSVTNWLQFAQIAESVRLAVAGPEMGLEHRSASSVSLGVHPLRSWVNSLIWAAAVMNAP